MTMIRWWWRDVMWTYGHHGFTINVLFMIDYYSFFILHSFACNQLRPLKLVKPRRSADELVCLHLHYSLVFIIMWAYYVHMLICILLLLCRSFCACFFSFFFKTPSGKWALNNLHPPLLGWPQTPMIEIHSSNFEFCWTVLLCSLFEGKTVR
jgi:hypothetical protein